MKYAIKAKSKQLSKKLEYLKVNKVNDMVIKIEINNPRYESSNLVTPN